MHGWTHHVVPLRTLAKVWLALAALTWLTVAATHFDFGALNLWIALGIATLKASLVVLYFMHLRWDPPFYALVFITALVFVMVFVGLTLIDTTTYQPELIPGYAPALGR